MILQLRHAFFITQSLKEIYSGRETGLIDTGPYLFPVFQIYWREDHLSVMIICLFSVHLYILFNIYDQEATSCEMTQHACTHNKRHPGSDIFGLYDN